MYMFLLMVLQVVRWSTGYYPLRLLYLRVTRKHSLWLRDCLDLLHLQID